MSRLLHYGFVFAITLCCAGLDAAANSQTRTAKKPPAGSVSGRVTIHGKGAPGIVVAVRIADYSPPPIVSFKATTDADGNYRVTGLLAGSYQVAPIAPAYVLPDLVAAYARGKPLLLAEGEDVQNVDFSLERGGVIAGKVTDADGRPVVEERLTLVAADLNGPNPQMYGGPFSAGAQTDDRGVYRMYGLVPGQYKIFAGRDDGSYYSVGPARVVYEKTFYPGTTEPAKAKVIEVTEGSESTNIDITIGRTLPGFVASGKLVDGETGQPVSGLRIGLRRLVNNDYAGANVWAVANSQGDFRLENITPGKYAAMILPLPGVETRAESAPFEVVDQDVTGLVVKTLKGLSINGTVVVEGKNDSNMLAKLADLRLQAYVRGEGSMPNFGQSATINADGSFRIGGLSAGIANFALGSQEGRPPVNFIIVRIERDGVVQPRGLELTAAESQVTGVKLVLRYGNGSVRGEVKLENGPLPVGGRVTVWIRRAGETSSGSRPYNTDLRGRFLIEGVSAGDYELTVQANVPGRQPPSVTEPITVTDGNVSEVVVTLDLNPKPGQPPGP